MKPEKDRAQLSLLEGDEFDYFYFGTNTKLPSEKVVIAYEKRGNAENYIKEAIRYGSWTLVTPILLGQRSHFSVDDDGLQIVFVVLDGLCKWNRISAANQNVQAEVHISGRDDHQNGKKCRVENLKNYPYQEIYEKSLS